MNVKLPKPSYVSEFTGKENCQICAPVGLNILETFSSLKVWSHNRVMVQRLRQLLLLSKH